MSAPSSSSAAAMGSGGSTGLFGNTGGTQSNPRDTQSEHPAGAPTLVIDEDDDAEDDNGDAKGSRRVSGARKVGRSMKDVAIQEYAEIATKFEDDFLSKVGDPELRATSLNGHINALRSKKSALSTVQEYELCGQANTAEQHTEALKTFQQAWFWSMGLCLSCCVGTSLPIFIMTRKSSPYGPYRMVREPIPYDKYASASLL
jgi:hypothetical protein